MNLFALSGVLTFLTSTTMGIFVLFKTPSNLTNRIWAYFTFFVAGWGISVFFIATTKNENIALLIWQATYATNVTLIPIFFLYFVHRFLNIPKNLVLLITCLIGLYFSIEIVSGNLIKHVGWVFNSFYYSGRPPTNLHIAYFWWWILVIFYSHCLLIKNYRKVAGIKREQIKYFFLATSIGFTGGITCFFPALNIDIYPYGNLAVPLYPPIMTYAILKYQLMDIQIVIRKSLIYSSLITIITIIYLISVLLFERIFHDVFGYKNITSSVFTATLIALIFIPLKNRIQYFIDKIFFRGSTLEVSQENDLLRDEVAQTEKFKSVAALASSLAHEIKNPLTAIMTFTDHLDKKSNDPAFMDQYKSIVSKETQRINSLLQELLTFAKPSAPQMQRVNPHELMDQIIHLIGQKCESAKIRIKTSYHTNTDIQADPNQLKQALLNIMLNAIDAMPDGGILTIQTSVILSPAVGGTKNLNKPLDPSVAVLPQDDGTYIITICDTGCGIDPKDLPHIFEPFYSKKEKGTGLGLAITQGIIEKHGGTIKVETKINQGTIFKIALTSKKEPING